MGLSAMCSFRHPLGTWNTVPTHMCSFISKMCVQEHINSNTMKTVDMQFLKL